MKILERDDVYSLLALHILADQGGDAADDGDEEEGTGGLPTSCCCNLHSDGAPPSPCAVADAQATRHGADGKPHRAARRLPSRLRLLHLAAAAAAACALQLALAVLVYISAPETGKPPVPVNYYATVHFQTVWQAGSRVAEPSVMFGSVLPTYNTTLIRALDVETLLRPSLTLAFMAEAKRQGGDLHNLSCACTVDVKASSGGALICTDGTRLAARATPDCFLCGAAWGSPGCTIDVSGGSVAARAAVLKDVQMELKNYDKSILSLLYSAAASEDSRAKVDRFGLEIAPWAFGDKLPAPKANKGAVVALAMVVLSLYVHKEAARAWTLARIILTHTGLMPPIYRPLSVAGGRNLESWGGPRETGRNALLLSLPLAQAAVAFVVLMAGAHTFVSTDPTSPGSFIPIVYNSAALLFVLEIDNAVAAMICDQEHAVLAKAELRDHITPCRSALPVEQLALEA